MKISAYLAVAMLLIVAPFCACYGKLCHTNTEKESMKVLMIGNSFSVCLLHQMPQVCEAMDKKLDLVSMYIGGCTLDAHATNLKATNKAPYHITWNYASLAKDEQNKVPFYNLLAGDSYKTSNIIQMLSSEKWDIVTLQQGSHKSWISESYEPFGTELIEAIKKYAPSAKIMVQETWSYTPWDSRLESWSITPKEMYAKLHEAYALFAKNHNLEIIPFGSAVEFYRGKLPVRYTENSSNDICGTTSFKKVDDKWVPDGDVFHLNSAGHYFQALLWTKKIFACDISKCQYKPDYLTDEEANFMRKIVSEFEVK